MLNILNSLKIFNLNLKSFFLSKVYIHGWRFNATRRLRRARCLLNR